MGLLRWKEVPVGKCSFSKPGDRMWGAVYGDYSFIKSYIVGHGWSVSWQHRFLIGARTHRHPGNPFATEAAADAMIEAKARELAGLAS